MNIVFYTRHVTWEWYRYYKVKCFFIPSSPSLKFSQPGLSAHTFTEIGVAVITDNNKITHHCMFLPNKLFSFRLYESRLNWIINWITAFKLVDQWSTDIVYLIMLCLSEMNSLIWFNFIFIKTESFVIAERMLDTAKCLNG